MKISFISELGIDRWKRFRKIRRAWWSLLILSGAFFLSLLGGLVAGDHPLVMSYGGSLYFPAFTFHSDKEFGGNYNTEADYLKLKAKKSFHENGNWMIMPLIPHDPLHTYLDEEGDPPLAPSLKHWLGTDSMARDILSRIFHGFRICMLFSLVLAFVSTFFGIVIGGVQGYIGGKFDLGVQRFIEIWASLPFLYVVILMGSVYGRSFALLLFVMALFQWIGLSYYMRGEYLKIRKSTFVEAAKVLKMGHVHIFFKQILPNALTPVITILPFSIIGGIGALTSLDFLGFGLQPPTPSWGELMKQGLENLYAPWIAISSVAALFITLLLATFIGEGVREAFDPKSGGHLE